MCDQLICWPDGILRRLYEAVLRDKSIVQEGGKFCCDDLIRDAKRPADTHTDKSIKRVCAPPEAPPQIAYVLPSTSLAGLLCCCISQARLDVFPVLVVQSEINGQSYRDTDNIPMQCVKKNTCLCDKAKGTARVNLPQSGRYRSQQRKISQQ